MMLTMWLCMSQQVDNQANLHIRENLVLEKGGASRSSQKSWKCEHRHPSNSKTTISDRQGGLKPLRVRQVAVGQVTERSAQIKFFECCVRQRVSSEVSATLVEH